MPYCGTIRLNGFKPTDIKGILWGDNSRRQSAPRDVAMEVAREMALASSTIFVFQVGNTTMHEVKLKM